MLLSGYGAAVQLVRRLLEGWTTVYHFVPIEDLTNYVHFLKYGIYREPWKAYYPCHDWPNSEWTLQKPIRLTPSGPPLLWRPGARFTNDFLPAIQIRRKLRLAVILLLAIRSQQNFAHATTAQLSCHVHNFVAIIVLESRWEWNEISIEFELRWRNR